MSDSIPYKSGGALVKLAPDLLALERRSNSVPYEQETIPMVAGVEKEILAYSVKTAVSFIFLQGLALESMTCRMLVDGIEIWDSTVTLGDSTWALYGDIVSGQPFRNTAFQVTSSLSLLLTTTTDTSIVVDHIGTKIL
jgi:hypothetical protein